MVTPLLFMLSTSLKTQPRSTICALIPATPTLDNYVAVLFGRALPALVRQFAA